MAATYVVYWKHEDVAPLREAVDRLQADLNRRQPYIGIEVYARMANRLLILQAAITTLTERAD